MSNYFEGLGVTTAELESGTVVMVPYGQVNTLVNGGPCLIAWAIVRRRVDEHRTATAIALSDKYWLDVYLSADSPPLPQMYAAGEILGVPALGLQMAGAPDRTL